MRKTPIAALLTLSLAAASCGCRKGPVSYDDPGSTTVSQDFSDTDIRTAAGELGASLAKHPAIAKAVNRPKILALRIKNKTDRRITTSVIVSQIETRLLSAGKVEFIDGAVRPELAKEYAYMASGNVAPAEAKGPGNQAGADYVLHGTIENVPARQGKHKVDYYYIKLTLVDVTRGTKTWQGEVEIKKRIRK
jgi:penicillin-binding protein activator